MQHRRLLRDDNLGVSDYLNETDTKDNGIRVTAKYYMQVFDYTKGRSRQREQQINMEQPLQYSFIFKYKNGTAPKSE
jgi:hypothetical protein